MSLIEDLKEQKENIQLVIFKNNGFTAYCKDSFVTGYDRITPEVVAKFNEHKVPMVDASKLDISGSTLLTSFPMVQSEDDVKWEFPYSGMSYAPPEVVASLYHRAGAELHNIEPINLVPEMFGSLSTKQAYAASGFFNNNADHMAKAMTMEEQDQGVPSLPGGEKLKGTAIADYFEKVSAACRSLADKASALKEKESPKPIVLSESYNDMVEIENAAGHMSRVLAKAGYEAALVLGGNKTDKEAAATAKAWAKNMVSVNLQNYKARGLRKEKDGHGYMFEGLKQAKNLISDMDGPRQAIEPK